jgi:hypothetical protein
MSGPSQLLQPAKRFIPISTFPVGLTGWMRRGAGEDRFGVPTEGPLPVAAALPGHDRASPARDGHRLCAAIPARPGGPSGRAGIQLRMTSPTRRPRSWTIRASTTVRRPTSATVSPRATTPASSRPRTRPPQGQVGHRAAAVRSRSAHQCVARKSAAAEGPPPGQLPGPCQCHHAGINGPLTFGSIAAVHPLSPRSMRSETLPRATHGPWRTGDQIRGQSDILSRSELAMAAGRPSHGMRHQMTHRHYAR